MISISEEKTTIALKRQTKEELAKLGKKDQTFDQIIRELLKKWEEEN
jgi:hypothetical protein